MDIRNRRAVRKAASETVRCNTGNPRMLVLAYFGAIAGSTLLVAVLSMILSSRINATGGLGNLGLRSVLTTIQICLPIAQVVILGLVQLGYQRSTVKMARHQPVYPRDLTEGFRFFGPLLRVTLLQGIVFMMMDFITSQVASILFMMTPFYQRYAAAQDLLFADSSILSSSAAVDMDLLLQMYESMLPMLLIWLPLFCFAALPFFYSCRMIPYVLVERPGTGALMALGESGRMMHGNRLALFKHDLSYWWFHLPQFLLKGFLFGCVLVVLIGFPQNLEESLIICAMMAGCLLLMGILSFFFQNRVETTYATIYELLRPKPREETQSGGAVLGNIFDLAKDYHED